MLVVVPSAFDVSEHCPGLVQRVDFRVILYAESIGRGRSCGAEGGRGRGRGGCLVWVVFEDESLVREPDLLLRRGWPKAEGGVVRREHFGEMSEQERKKESCRSTVLLEPHHAHLWAKENRSRKRGEPSLRRPVSLSTSSELQNRSAPTRTRTRAGRRRLPRPPAADLPLRPLQSPAAEAGIDPFFDFICGVNGRPLVSSDSPPVALIPLGLAAAGREAGGEADPQLAPPRATKSTN